MAGSLGTAGTVNRSTPHGLYSMTISRYLDKAVGFSPSKCPKNQETLHDLSDLASDVKWFHINPLRWLQVVSKFSSDSRRGEGDPISGWKSWERICGHFLKTTVSMGGHCQESGRGYNCTQIHILHYL